jgi:hypothetical protein
MSYTAALDLARQGRLYPSVILYGASFEDRVDAVLELSRILLCVADAGRPCGVCRQCSRIVWPEKGVDKFHPDFHVLERDLKNSTSVETTKALVKATVATPFEARGQVFVVAEADTLTPGAADALLKTLEEPPARTPRHFFLLAASRLDLLPTLRSRSLSLFLGGAATLEAELVDEALESLAPVLSAYFSTSAPVYLLACAEVFGRFPGWDDTRAKRPWAMSAATILAYVRRTELAVRRRRALLALAAALLDAWPNRLRGITAPRILEGLLSRHLAAV